MENLIPNDDEFQMKHLMLKEEAGIFTSNMYLAEDRILCFELVAKRVVIGYYDIVNQQELKPMFLKD